MNRYRGNAIVVGILLIACTAASILSVVPLGSTLDSSDYLNQLAASDSRVIWTALIEFAWAATGAGIAIALYPVIRRHHPGLALASVAGRVAEGMFVLIGTVSLLALLTVGQESLAPGADPAAFSATGDALLAVRDWTMGFVGVLPFLAAALMYYYVLYRNRLSPGGSRAGGSPEPHSAWSPRSTAHTSRTSASPRSTRCSISRFPAGNGVGRVVAGQRVHPVAR